MVVSAMFYGTSDNVESPYTLRLGFIVITVQELFVSAISVAIVFPPSLLIIQIFRNVNVREKQTNKRKLLNDENAPKNQQQPKRKVSVRKRPKVKTQEDEHQKKTNGSIIFSDVGDTASSVVSSRAAAIESATRRKSKEVIISDTEQDQYKNGRVKEVSSRADSVESLSAMTQTDDRHSNHDTADYDDVISETEQDLPREDYQYQYKNSPTKELEILESDSDEEYEEEEYEEEWESEYEYSDESEVEDDSEISESDEDGDKYGTYYDDLWSDDSTTFSGSDSDDSDEEAPSQPKKKGLPAGCLFVAWIIAVLSIITPAFFVILYSMSWGPEISNSWLVSYVLSFFESVLITDPIKVTFYLINVVKYAFTILELNGYWRLCMSMCLTLRVRVP